MKIAALMPMVAASGRQTVFPIGGSEPVRRLMWNKMCIRDRKRTGGRTPPVPM